MITLTLVLFSNGLTSKSLTKVWLCVDIGIVFRFVLLCIKIVILIRLVLISLPFQDDGSLFKNEYYSCSLWFSIGHATRSISPYDIPYKRNSLAIPNYCSFKFCHKCRITNTTLRVQPRFQGVYLNGLKVDEDECRRPTRAY